jgi:hypothetical protein
MASGVCHSGIESRLVGRLPGELFHELVQILDASDTVQRFDFVVR